MANFTAEVGLGHVCLNWHEFVLLLRINDAKNLTQNLDSENFSTKRLQFRHGELQLKLCDLTSKFQMFKKISKLGFFKYKSKRYKIFQKNFDYV